MSAEAVPARDRLLLALLIAATLHVLLVFGITFDAWRSSQTRHQVEVVLVQTPDRRPRQAEHIAQADQRGSGARAQRDASSGALSALPQIRADAAPAPARPDAGRERLVTPAIATSESSRRVVDRRGERQNKEDVTETEQALARLNQELVRLRADLDVQRQKSARNPRVRRLDAVSARASVHAAYLAEWRRRVETVGNRYYPQASLRYGIYGSLEMLVTVRSDGELEAIEILNSSGYAVLDEAAVRIVRLAAPFPPFSDALRETTDKLEILRTWQFEQNALSSNRVRADGS